jgi:hypothetical protein
LTNRGQGAREFRRRDPPRLREGIFMRYWLLGSWFAASLGLAAPAAAQTPSQQQDSAEIVVTGNRDTDQQVRDFVGALAQAPLGGQLSRFESAICPIAVGVSPAQKDVITRRMKAIAKAAGIAVGGADCTPNVLLVVTSDKKAFIEALWKKHNYYFGEEMSGREVRRLAQEPSPAAAWQVAGPPVTADGHTMEQSGGNPAVNRTTRLSSRITSGARPQFAAAAVVVETKALEGLTTTQLADYAAMRAFTRTDPSKLAGSAPTILNVLDAPMGTEVPITMTPWDLAFLKSLYAAPANLSAAAQRSQIGKGMKKELQQPQKDK